MRVRALNLHGDGQSDLSVHGGVDKAVYAYPSEHYAYWRGELPGTDLPWGVFGENFTTLGLLEKEVQIGDRFHAGTAEFIVTQPRLPCFKLGIRFADPRMVRRFLRSGRLGFYMKVAVEGEAAAGDPIELLSRQERGVTVAGIAELYNAKGVKPGLLRRVSELPDLSRNWRDHFRARLRKTAASA